MIKLYDHQKEIYRLLADHPYFAIFAEQGTGKTLAMLLHICRLLRAGDIKSALVICPKAVRGSWKQDKEKLGPLDRLLLERHLTVTTYDLIWRRAELDREWDLICLDESHFIKNRTSNRYSGQIRTVTDPQTGKRKRQRITRGIGQISRSAKYRYIMTGTPIGNSHWEEIWAQFDFLDPAILGKYSAFEKRYCLLNQYFKPWKYLHVEELKEIIRAYSYTVKKADCLDLPDKLPPERYTLELKEKKLYKEMLKNYIEELDIEAKNPLARMTKLRQMCSGHIRDDAGRIHRIKCEKAQTLAEFLDNWEKKLAIFCEFRESITDVTAVLGRHRVPYVVLDGAQKDKSVWKRFQKDPSIQVIVCQYRTASTGIDLYAADTILFYEPTLSSQTFEQACDRIHRVGQTQKCSYILLETEGTVETKIWDALMRYRDFNENELWSYIKERRAS